MAEVMPVFIKGDAKLFNNYQPISLLPSISKIFETVLCNQIYKYLEIQNNISDKQYGLRKKNSTEYTAI